MNFLLSLSESGNASGESINPQKADSGSAMPDFGNKPRVKMRICAVGEEAVGKTSLIRRFVGDVFAEEYIRTIGTLINKKTLEVGHSDGEPAVVDAVLLGVLAALGLGTFALLALFRQKETQETATESP